MVLAAFLISGFWLLSSCNELIDTADSIEQTGTLEFRVNGEDFVRNGFVSEDGWQIDFERVLVNLSGIAAYQVVETASKPGLRHPGHDHGDLPADGEHALLTGAYLVDLKTEQPALLGSIDAVSGNYNRLNFRLESADTDSTALPSVEGDFTGGDYSGWSMVMQGTAAKDAATVSFDIRFEQTASFSSCGPNGEAGLVSKDRAATAEITLHFDHIFGDQNEGPADTSDQNAVNFTAVGFQSFADLAVGSSLTVTQSDLASQLSSAVYVQLINAISTMGHSGEAHCITD